MKNHEAQIEERKRNFGLHWSLWDKYRLEKFEVNEGNYQAFKMACEYLMVDEKVRSASDVFGEDGLNTPECDEWYGQFPCLHHFLTFAGACGRGKTRLAIGIGIATIEKVEMSAFYVQVADLLSKLRASFESDTGVNYQTIINQCRNADLLILDDLGMQHNTPWALEQLDSLVDFRYIRELQTVFTTNMTLDKLPSRIASRIIEGEICVLNGPDFRQIIAERRINERIKSLGDDGKVKRKAK